MGKNERIINQLTFCWLSFAICDLLLESEDDFQDAVCAVTAVSHLVCRSDRLGLRFWGRAHRTPPEHGRHDGGSKFRGEWLVGMVMTEIHTVPFQSELAGLRSVVTVPVVDIRG